MAASVFALTSCKQDDLEAGEDAPVYLKYVSAGTELVPLMKAGTAEYGVLGEPLATRAKGAAGVEIVGALSAWWNEVHPEFSNFPQAVLVAKNSFVANGKNADFIRALYVELIENATWLLENPSAAAAAVEAHGGAGLSPLSRETAERCNIKPSYNAQIRQSITTYLGALYDLNPQSIGG